MYASTEVEQFHLAVFRGKKKQVKALASHDVVNGRRKDGVTALHIVATTGSTRICKLLLSHRPALEARESHGASPLNLACQNNNSGVVRLLLEAGADVNSARTDGVAPLYIAAQEGHVKVVQLLLQYKADPSQTRPVSGASPLFVAVQKGRSKVVELLVAAGAPVDAAVEHVTALEAAVHAGHMRCAQVLIAAHAHIVQGGQIRAREESEALKWLQQAQECLVEIEETPPGEDESQRLLSFRGGAMKKKDLAGLSKKDMLTKYSGCLKANAKVASKLRHAEECLAQEREAARREIANWKMAFMMASSGFVLPPEEEEPKSEPHDEEVGAQRKDSDVEL